MAFAPSGRIQWHGGIPLIFPVRRQESKALAVIHSLHQFINSSLIFAIQMRDQRHKLQSVKLTLGGEGGAVGLPARLAAPRARTSCVYREQELGQLCISAAHCCDSSALRESCSVNDVIQFAYYSWIATVTSELEVSHVTLQHTGHRLQHNSNITKSTTHSPSSVNRIEE